MQGFDRFKQKIVWQTHAIANTRKSTVVLFFLFGVYQWVVQSLCRPLSTMIYPQTTEDEWHEYLCEVPSWTPAAPRRTLIISPHPDDETLGAGGLIAFQSKRGVPVTIAAVTDGENAYKKNNGLREIRRHEQSQAATCLGLKEQSIKRFGLSDSGLAQCQSDLCKCLSPFIDEDTHIVAPWTGDFHPDHETCGRVAEKIAHETGAELTFYLFWTWHRARPNLLRGLSLVRFDLNDALLSAKQRALGCYRSQLERDDEPPILPENLLHPANRAFEIFITT